MKDKNLPDDIDNKSLNELTKMADNVIENLENQKELEQYVDEYNKLIKLNNIIEKKFQNSSKQISINTKEKITRILKKNEKKNK
tara:strand:- start:271 stop:522 length:252 start_codon:yes stop_codon:yes gene_type:complete